MCLIMMIAMSNKQHVSNIWHWIHEKAKQHWGWVEKKSVAYKKSVYMNENKMNIICYYVFNPFKLKVETWPKIF